MKDHLIHFHELDWEHPFEGVAQKIHVHGAKRMRLIRFSPGFAEEDWCTKGHIGFVISGKMHIDFNGEMKDYRQGDGIWIEKGQAHKATVSVDGAVELILFEEVDRIA